jgi:competence protein ComEA
MWHGHKGRSQGSVHSTWPGPGGASDQAPCPQYRSSGRRPLPRRSARSADQRFADRPSREVGATTRLPRIGPGLAGRIVADRVSNGPFGSLAGLDRVAGVGPTVLEAVASHVVFSGQPRQDRNRAVKPVRLSTATVDASAGDWGCDVGSNPQPGPTLSLVA